MTSLSLLHTGAGNDNPLQYSCLENPRVGEPDGLLSMRPHRVGHDLSNLAAAAGNEFKVSFCRDENVLELVLMIAQLHECIKNH